MSGNVQALIPYRFGCRENKATAENDNLLRNIYYARQFLTVLFSTFLSDFNGTSTPWLVSRPVLVLPLRAHMRTREETLKEQVIGHWAGNLQHAPFPGKQRSSPHPSTISCRKPTNYHQLPSIIWSFVGGATNTILFTHYKKWDVGWLHRTVIRMNSDMPCCL